MPRRRSGGGVTAKGRNKGGGQFVPIPYPMAQCAAFRSLNGSAVKVWVELRSRFNGYNNGQVSLSFQDAADLLGMSKTTVGRAFKELEDKGFIKLRKRGHWYGRMASEYTLTDIHFCGHSPTRDWQRWRPSKSAENKSSVPRRTRQTKSGPSEYRDSEFPVQQDTRHGKLRVIDGSA